MKNITPQSDPRQNNCRNTTSLAIAPHAGVDNGHRSWHSDLAVTVVVPFDRGRHKQNPDRSNDRGFPFLRAALPYQSLRFASAMMMTFKPANVQITSVSSDRLQ